MSRILVTGSRTWADWGRLSFWLGHGIGQLRNQYMSDSPYHGGVVVVHGDCPKGADRMAQAICDRYQVPTEKHPADWDRYGRRAGFIRNDEMVQMGADLCLAFIKDQSRGATMCADLAERAGIETIRFLA